MPTDQPKELFSHEMGRNAFNGIVISRQRGDLFLLPIHEIVWISATPLGEAGCVEIQTRHRLIRLGLSRMDACHKLIDLLFKGGVSHIHEGTAPPQADHDHHQLESQRGKPKTPAVTLVVEILDLDADSAGTGQPGSPPLPATEPAADRRPGLGFPSL